MSRRLAPVILSLLLTGCADAHAGELACQQRIVEQADRNFLSPAAAEGFERMSLEGCSEDQRVRIRLTARAARELATTFARVRGLTQPSLPPPGSGEEGRRALLLLLEREPSLRDSQLFLEFQSQLEQYEMRRRALREELQRMGAEGG